MLAEKELCPENLKESLRAYAEGRPTGSFLRAVLENDLGIAVLRGDEQNKKLLPEIYAFMVDVVPSFARGSKAAVKAHLQKAEEDRAEYAASHGQQNDDAADLRTTRRIYKAAGCDLCESPGPPHDASPNCESGKREHCSCDVCF